MKYIEELQSLKEQLLFKGSIKDVEPFENIVIGGMGGSGIAGKIFQEIYSDKPVHLVDDYKGPSFISKKTLFIALSYSGNTEETVSSLMQAKSKGAYTVAITSGGKIMDLGDEVIKIPRSDLQPRAALGYLLMPLIRTFSLANASEITRTYKALKSMDENNYKCKKYAEEIVSNKLMPVIYGVSPFKSIAYRWKTQFNENGKILAYSSSFPELDHNDVLPLGETYNKNGFCFFVFNSTEERILKRISVTSEITKTKFHMIAPKGDSLFERLFYLVHYGDYISYHVGMLRGKDPSDITLLSKLKQMISK